MGGGFGLGLAGPWSLTSGGNGRGPQTAVERGDKRAGNHIQATQTAGDDRTASAAGQH